MADRNAAAVRTYVVEVETAALVCISSHNDPYASSTSSILSIAPIPPSTPLTPHALSQVYPIQQTNKSPLPTRSAQQRTSSPSRANSKNPGSSANYRQSARAKPKTE